MSFADERKSIEKRFNTEWTATPIAYDNVAFNPPSNADWVRLNIQNGDSGYRGLGRSIRHTGIINVQIFTPVNKATKTSRQYADIVSSIFSDQRFDDIVTDISSINIIDDDDAWLQTNVTTPYYRDAEKIFVPVPVFEPLYVELSNKLTINSENPEIIMSGDVDVITSTRLEISGIISCTFNYVVGIAVYVDDVAIGTGTRVNQCHDDCAFIHYDGSGTGRISWIKHLTYDLVTDFLGAGIHTIKIGILGKWAGNTHDIIVGDVNGNGIPSSSTLLVKEFGALNQGGGGFVPRDFSRLNTYLPIGSPFTTDPVSADVATKLLLLTTVKTNKDFTLDIPNQRYFFDAPGISNRWFLIHFSSTITTSVPNQTVTLNMHKNNVLEEGVGNSIFVTTGADIGGLPAVGVVKLSDGDYIEIFVTLSTNGTITFERATITINEMVGAI